MPNCVTADKRVQHLTIRRLPRSNSNIKRQNNPQHRTHIRQNQRNKKNRTHRLRQKPLVFLRLLFTKKRNISRRFFEPHIAHKSILEPKYLILNDMLDPNGYMNRYIAARDKWKPEKVAVLIIAESPP